MLYTSPLLVSVLGTAALVVYIWRHHWNKPEARKLALLMSAVAVWSLLYALELKDGSLPGKFFWARLKYLPIVVVPATWVVFALEYAGRIKWLSRRSLILLAIGPICTLLMVWTNNIHHLFWTDVALYTRDEVSTLSLPVGAGFWAAAAYSHLVFLFGAFIILDTLIRSQRLYRRQAGIILVGGVVPWLGNIVFLAGASPFPHLDMTPFSFAITCFVCAVGLSHYQLLDVVPVAHDAIIKDLDDAVMVIDVESRLVDMNLAAELLIGHSASESVGRPISQLWPHWPKSIEDSPAAGEYHEVALGEGKSRRTYEMRITCEPDSKGVPSCMVVMLHDITERKRAEKALRESEEKYRLHFENVNDCIYSLDKECRVTSVSPSVERLLGYRPEEIIGRLFQELNVLAPEHLEKAAAEIALVLTGARIASTEYEFITKDGERKLGEVSGAPLFEDNEIIGVVSVARDITQQKWLEQQLFQSQRMESIGTLAGGIAHDFNSLLGAVLGYASLTKTKISRDDQIYNYIDVIEKSAVRAAELASQLLAFAQGGKYESRPLDLNRVVEESIRAVENSLDKSIEIVTELLSPLPIIQADARQMQQVVMNLCVNARDAMPEGGTLKIRTEVERVSEENSGEHAEAKPGVYVCLSVADTGIGMDTENVKRIFEPFFTTKPQGKGTGLGLAMVYGVVKNHGGFVYVNSEPGKGSLFRLYLPVKQTPPAEPETPENGGPSTSADRRDS